jgi:hypothetical protein
VLPSTHIWETRPSSMLSSQYWKPHDLATALCKYPCLAISMWPVL